MLKIAQTKYCDKIKSKSNESTKIKRTHRHYIDLIISPVVVDTYTCQIVAAAWTRKSGKGNTVVN